MSYTAYGQVYFISILSLALKILLTEVKGGDGETLVLKQLSIGWPILKKRQMGTTSPLHDAQQLAYHLDESRNYSQ